MKKMQGDIKCKIMGEGVCRRTMGRERRMKREGD